MCHGILSKAASFLHQLVSAMHRYFDQPSQISRLQWDGSHVQWSHFEMQDSHHPGSVSVSDPGEESEEWQSDNEESSVDSDA